MRGSMVVFIVLATLAVLAAAYVFLAGNKTTLYTSKPTPSPTLTPTGVSEETTRDLTVQGGEYKFSPGSISLTKGEQVRINFKNTGRLPHNLTIDELGFATDTISGGKEISVELTADKTGTFVMYCSVGNHRALGMEGEVEVK